MLFLILLHFTYVSTKILRTPCSNGTGRVGTRKGFAASCLGFPGTAAVVDKCLLHGVPYGVSSQSPLKLRVVGQEYRIGEEKNQLKL